jgi:glutamine amidotransferase/cyclase
VNAVSVVATGHANVRSLLNALERLGVATTLTTDAERVRNAGRVILPGVGAFGAVMKRLDFLGLVAPLKERLRAGRPLLGICLGQQLLLTSSEESPGVPGLGAIPGTVKRLQVQEKIPHMGWNEVVPAGQDPVIGPSAFYAYFVHSYATWPQDEKNVTAWCEYGGTRFPAALRRGETVALQFHPERSGAAGLALLGRFLS